MCQLCDSDLGCCWSPVAILSVTDITLTNLHNLDKVV